MALVLGLGIRVGRKNRGTGAASYFARFFNLPEKVSETQLLDTTGNERHFTLTRRNCLIGDGVAKLVFSDLPTYDLLTIVEDGVGTEKTLTAGELVLSDTKKYNYAIFSNEDIEVAKFPLMEFDSDYDLPEMLNCYDVIGDASCVWDGLADKANGLSWNFRHGFTLLDGVYYPAGTGVEIVGGVQYPPYHTAANQYILAPADDTMLISHDTEEQFYDEGTPVNVHLADIYANDYLQVVGVGVIRDMRILLGEILAPSDVILTSNENSITVDWTINQEEVVGYLNGTVIERSVDGIEWTKIARIQYPTETYEDSNLLIEEVEYFYRLRSFVGNVYSNFSSSKSSYINYQSETVTYISALSTPISTETTKKIDNFIKSVKLGFEISLLSDVFDSMYLLANETSESALINLIKRENDAVTVNSPTFTSLEGFTGNGTTSYINTNYNPTADGINYTLNNAAFGYYSRTNVSGVMIDVAARTAFNNNASYATTRNGTTYTGKINRALTGVSFSNTDSLGFYHVVGESSNLMRVYRDNVSKGTVANATSGMPNFNFYALAANTNGTADNFSTRQLSLVYFSRALTQSEVDVLTVAFEVYMNSNNKGVLNLPLTIETALNNGTILY